MEELEKTGFTIQELKKVIRILIEIAAENQITNKEQIKTKFFELFEKFEDRMSLESKNNTAMQLNLFLENQIRTNRQTLHCQGVVGDILKNLFEKGITENQIVAVKALIDILSYISSSEGNNSIKKNIKYESFAKLYLNNNNNNSNSNWRKEYEKLKWPLNFILALDQIYL
ncbi:MAG TPA: hypothetical protein VFM31_08330 [Nitrososphaeraceae archaeon]|nr:hypothetical protein [Nitrososphaeraceae archaeon]